MLNPNFFTQVVEDGSTYGTFVLEPLPASLGQSIGNALRRVLLSSLEGVAVTDVKIEGAPHLFATLKGIKESVLELTLQIKKLRFEAAGAGPFHLKLSVKKPGKVYASSFEGDAKIVNTDLYLGEITDVKGKLEIEIIAEKGLGYSPVEEREKKEFGFIPVDTFFSPVTKVNFRVEEARVGRKSNVEKLTMEVTTDGSIKPFEALKNSTKMLSHFFGHLFSGNDTPVIPEVKSESGEQKEAIDKKLYEVIIDELNLPSRVINALLRENIETVADLVKVGRDKLTNMKGVGKKSIELIEEELKKMGIQLD